MLRDVQSEGNPFSRLLQKEGRRRLHLATQRHATTHWLLGATSCRPGPQLIGFINKKGEGGIIRSILGATEKGWPAGFVWVH